MNDDADFKQLVARLRAGDPAAIDTICRRYEVFLRVAVRRQLHPRLRARFDSIDVVQDVWLSFLAIPPDRLNFDTEQGLLGYLGQVAYHRVVDIFRQRFQTDKDDATREVESNAITPSPEWIVAQTPTPSVCVAANETWDKLLSQFPEGHRIILRQLRDGHDHQDIARQANVSLSTVNRVVRRLKELTGA